MGRSIYNENELVELVRNHSKIGFDYLYTNYSNALYGVIIKIVKNEEEANDILQEVFLKIWKNIDKYDPSYARFYTWMNNIARNASIDFLRTTYGQNKSKTTVFENNAENHSYGYEMSIDGIGLLKIADKLQTKYRVLIEMAFYKGLTYEEIAQQINLPLGTVKTRIRSALQTMRKDFAYSRLETAC